MREDGGESVCVEYQHAWVKAGRRKWKREEREDGVEENERKVSNSI
jgi:hypothetical protein